MTKADFKRLATAIHKANKMQTTEQGKRTVYQVTSYIAEEFKNIDFIGQVAELILDNGVND